MSIRENIDLIRARVTASCLKVDRNPDEVTIIGVSKQITKELMIEAYKAGIVNFGENYAQEFRDKYSYLHPEFNNAKWHFIGHLQKNKVKYIVGKVAFIHSVNSLGLAKEINARSEKIGAISDILVEIKSGNEPSKTGIFFTQAKDLIKEIGKLENIKFKGLMTMAPYFDDPELVRPYFKEVKLFSDELVKKHPDANEISMGMSGDFEIAVEEGSTIVRIGSAMFGSRNST